VRSWTWRASRSPSAGRSRPRAISCRLDDTGLVQRLLDARGMRTYDSHDVEIKRAAKLRARRRHHGAQDTDER
jgi:hypothetical protein